MDSGSNFPSGQDQRGQSVFDFPNIPSVLNGSDIDAFERQPDDFAGGTTPFDFDGDGDGTFDAAVFRPSTNTWFYNGSTSGNVQLNFGVSGDVPIPNVYSIE